MERVAETAELLGVEASIGKPKLEIGHATKDFIAGALSGMVGICAGQPLDTLRVRLQQRGSQATSTAAILRASGAKAGVRDLFRGMSYPLVTVALQNAVTFQSQGAAVRMLTGSTDSRAAVVSWQITCVSGMFAGAMSSFISSPTELLKIRMQLQGPLPGSPGYLGPWAMLQQVVRQEGLRGLTRGLGTTLVRDTPSYGVYFGVYHFSVQGLGQLLYPAADRAAAQPVVATPAAAAAAAGETSDSRQREQQQQQPGVDQPLLSSAIVAAQEVSKVWELQELQSQQHPQQQQLEALSLLQQAPQHLQLQQQVHHEQPQQLSQPASPPPPSKQRQQQHNPGASQPLVQFLAGGLAGAFAWMSIYPIDVVKCRMQAASALASPYNGAWECALSSWRQEGPRVFVKGLGATMGRGFVVNAAIFAAFEAVMDAMNA